MIHICVNNIPSERVILRIAQLTCRLSILSAHTSLIKMVTEHLLSEMHEQNRVRAICRQWQPASEKCGMRFCTWTYYLEF